ncbi:hypothetical protein J2S74_001528 [Evansella vedderi]|uniref:Uncharacterized protein n=1 Tax=Evansella vedderi TaxID=38282 RepID=A0ABT9ZVK8_9BACI|nr:hypothetical protein [Evansella vedderi]MDQ0254155.1 hypothetical protein [Evansella vedderi]
MEMQNKSSKVVPIFKRIKIKSSSQIIKEMEQVIENYKNRKKGKESKG